MNFKKLFSDKSFYEKSIHIFENKLIKVLPDHRKNRQKLCLIFCILLLKNVSDKAAQVKTYKPNIHRSSKILEYLDYTKYPFLDGQTVLKPLNLYHPSLYYHFLGSCAPLWYYILYFPILKKI